jgi:hypothetical protein
MFRQGVLGVLHGLFIYFGDILSWLAALGLLIEGQATNLFSRTDDLSVSPWALQAVTVGATRVLGPDGTLSAQRFTPTGADAALSQDRVPAAAIAHTATYWLRSNTGGSFDTFIRLVRNSPFTTVFSQAITVTPEWRPYTITATPLDTSAHRWRLGAGSAWSTGEEMDVWVPQLETGTVSTSTIPNPGTGTALRTGDFAGGGISGANLAALLTPTAPFTIVLPFRKANNAAAVETLLGLCAGASAGTTNQLGIATNALNQVKVDARLRSVDDPDIYALGDCAAVVWAGHPGRLVPPRAQAAHQQAMYLVKALRRRLAGKTSPAWRYRDFGSLVSLGEYSTVGNLMGNFVGGNLWLEGLFARWMYQSLYKMHEIALHGWWKTSLTTLARLIARQTEPRVKLH